MADLWCGLLDCLDLHGDAPSEFEGNNQQLSYHRVFGGIDLLPWETRTATASLSGCR